MNFSRLLPFLFALLAAVVSADAQAPRSTFLDFFEKRISLERPAGSSSAITLKTVCSIESSPLERRVFHEYGSIFAATADVRIPLGCIFADSAAVRKFQHSLETTYRTIGGHPVQLQTPAMNALAAASAEAESRGLSITPLDGWIGSSRSYNDTVRIWNLRFFRALDHWTRQGFISSEEAAAAVNSPIRQQAEMVMAWEEKGFYFSTGFSRSIFRSVAPPGTSQHLSLLAFDLEQHGDARIRAIMNRHGWYQTILTDTPHFTYIGVTENELPRRGLRNIARGGHSYWIPDIAPVPQPSNTSAAPLQ